METNEKKDENLSRRGFVTNAFKALPFLGLLGMGLVSSSGCACDCADDCSSGCEGGCGGGCYGGCSSSCGSSCSGSCGGTCSGDCYASCQGSCGGEVNTCSCGVSSGHLKSAGGSSTGTTSDVADSNHKSPKHEVNHSE